MSIVANGGDVTIRVVQDASVATSGAQSTIAFDRNLLQVTSVTPAGSYAGAPVFVGAEASAIASANVTGKLSTVAAAFLPPGSVAPGVQDFLVVGFKATGCGQTVVDLPVGPADAALLDGTPADYGKSLTVTTTSGAVSICGASAASDTAAGGTSLLPIILVGLVVAAAAGAGLWFMRGRARSA